MLRIVALLSLPCLLGACAISEEEKAFYYRGWLNPRDLDEPPPAATYGGPPVPTSRHYKKDPLID